MTWIDLRLLPAACVVWGVTLTAPRIGWGLLAASAAGCALVALPVARYGRRPAATVGLTVLAAAAVLWADRLERLRGPVMLALVPLALLVAYASSGLALALL